MTTTTLILQGVFWAAAYVAYECAAKTAFATIKFQDERINQAVGTLRNKRGAFRTTSFDETLDLFIIGIHHLFCGTLVALGALMDNSTLITTGVLCEWGFELKDIIDAALYRGSYSDGLIAKSYRNTMLFHHIPGLLSAYPILIAEYHASHHVRAIAAGMILAGGVGIICGRVATVLNVLPGKPFASSVKQMMWFETFASFGLVRFAVFPYHVGYLISDLVQDNHVALPIVVSVASLAMMVFNVRVFRVKYDHVSAVAVDTKLIQVRSVKKFSSTTFSGLRRAHSSGARLE